MTKLEWKVALAVFGTLLFVWGVLLFVVMVFS